MSVTFEQVKALLDQESLDKSACLKNKLAYFMAQDPEIDAEAAMSILVRTEMFSAVRLLLCYHESTVKNSAFTVEILEQEAETLSECSHDDDLVNLLHEIIGCLEVTSAASVFEIVGPILNNIADCCSPR